MIQAQADNLLRTAIFEISSISSFEEYACDILKFVACRVKLAERSLDIVMFCAQRLVKRVTSPLPAKCSLFPILSYPNGSPLV